MEESKVWVTMGMRVKCGSQQREEGKMLVTTEGRRWVT